MDYLIDTTFLIRLWRERQSSREHRFIALHTDDSVAMPWVVKGEFLRGAILAGQDEEEISRFLDRYPTKWVTEDTLRQYAGIYMSLVRSRLMVGVNDLWIAASALEHGLPLLTRNVSDFRRVDGLQVVEYAAGEY